MTNRAASLRSLLILTLCAVRTAGAHAQTTEHAPQLFGEGIFSTAAWDFFVAFTPDQRTAYVCRASGDFSYFTILETTQRAGTWQTPRVAPFSGKWSDADPHITPDGTKLFFISNRPLNASDTLPRSDYDIWFVERTAPDSWGTPQHVGAPVNANDATEWSPSVAANGNLYFGTVRAGGKGGNDLYVARWVNGAYQAPENLGDSINTARGEVEPWIAPDESYLIFSGQGRPDGVGGFDLYIAKRANGVWRKAMLIGDGVSSPSGDFNQSVSPDGKWLYFSSSRSVFNAQSPQRRTYAEIQRLLLRPGNGLGDIYRIEMTRVLEPRN